MANGILVSDLDPLTPRYEVVDEGGHNLGKKFPVQPLSNHPGEYLYEKPAYDRRGRRTGGRNGWLKDRSYKGAPPWMKYEVFKIDTFGGYLTFHVRKISKEENENG